MTEQVRYFPYQPPRYSNSDTAIPKLLAATGMSSKIVFIVRLSCYVSSYFASKKCTYTDASGRPVPAPRPFKGDHPDTPADTRQGSYATYPDGAQCSQPTFVTPAQHQGEALAADSDDDSVSRKRFRPELAQPTPPVETPGRGLAPPSLPSTERSLERDPSLTRELVHRKSQYRRQVMSNW